METVEILPYNSNWPHWFQLLKAKLKDCLGEFAISIDHIGSTSVPGLSSKDKIDVQVTIQDISEDIQKKLDQALLQGGFLPTQYGSDHRPAGDTSSIKEWEKYIVSGKNTDISFSFNIHFRALGKKNQKYALLFRDYLRANKVAAAAYQSLKETLAKYHTDNIYAYVDIKDSACDIIMSSAWEWEKHLKSESARP